MNGSELCIAACEEALYQIQKFGAEVKSDSSVDVDELKISVINVFRGLTEKIDKMERKKNECIARLGETVDYHYGANQNSSNDLNRRLTKANLRVNSLTEDLTEQKQRNQLLIADLEKAKLAVDKNHALAMKRICSECRQNIRNTVLVPCNHLTTCNDCAVILSHCPECETEVLDRIVALF